MQLDVPLVKQTSNDSIDCGIAGLSMIFKFYKVEEHISNLKKLHLYEHVGTYMPQLGEYLQSCGFETEIITANPHLFTFQHGELSQEELLDYLKESFTKINIERFKEPLSYFIKFMEKGGKLTIKVPSKEDIKQEITANRPLCAILTSNVLLFNKASFNFHFNVITGIDDTFVYVNDPLLDYRGGKHKYPVNDFFFALHSSAHGDLDNASIMKIKKK
jgi:hypothetical protein